MTNRIESLIKSYLNRFTSGCGVWIYKLGCVIYLQGFPLMGLAYGHATRAHTLRICFLFWSNLRVMARVMGFLRGLFVIFTNNS
ncbi:MULTISPECIES: hypothetical protein [Moorena]|uniref:Uncharacterized protein n=1 Tax=Moorena producens 3L TaxID=489825 RepID=F4XQW8_9CYAN|nr:MULTISPECIES: hypothetical protein [Moorena]NEQ14415.1 hypothetical protein [Moorena sp. SIO3E2]EGJ32943.1 hypothetical protein LYNGBM3L_55350 [Moorena producens 3L]NEP30698.1 hypothetical protein [Moorena sp. SIO3B2]NER89850.1 hypothetical protein [Moorena sp. SIO3A2]NES41935.1 hypothetical protein [Moorena sp. SIO2C4]